MSTQALPRRVRVAEVLEGRYLPGKKPLSWDDRAAGVDTIRTAEGETLRLFSGGGQATPAPGWELLLTKLQQSQDGSSALRWTLFGIQ